MAAKAKTTAETKTANSTPFTMLAGMATSLINQIQVPTAARDYTAQGAKFVIARADDIREGAFSMTGSAEKAIAELHALAGDITRDVIAATYDNVVMTAKAVEKLSAAASAKDAFQISVDYVRDYARVNVARVQGGFEQVQSVAQSNVALVQGELAKVVPFIRKAG